MKEVTSLLILQNVMLTCSWSLDDVCDADDIKCQNPQMLTPGEITYEQCYRNAALRRLLQVSFLTCLKECMKTSTCSNVSYRRDWKMCDINGKINPEVELVQEHGCFSSNISSWSKKLVGKCATHNCAEGYKCVVKGEEITCEIAYCIGRPFAANAELDEPFGLSRDLGHGMKYVCTNRIQMIGKPFAVCRQTGKWKSMFICGEGSLVSHHKTAGQSTIHCANGYLCEPEAGVDGIKQLTNIFHTDLELEPFWWVNLGQVYTVLKVVSTNRMHSCCGNRLRKMLIHVEENLDTSNTELCGQFIGPAVSGQVIVTPCNTLPKGHLVKLTSVNTVPTVFHLTEVEVYGIE
ncbi:Hypothetical predicted protein [Mytilus galloprovincialis]|uniref:Fucolectin tachylectin-4 pentraxin-1 domain-containing protein n=1 Tax=Mytilus galloprovincialis TaxID=29158 RepID=A0A8B6GRN1_MYTGA|nr:Hypothetical predicted protein [Mytilus galloprovincialis]